MRRLKAIVQLSVVFILCLSVWLLVKMTALVMSEHPSSSLDHVPAKADFAVRIDGRQIAETTLLSVLLESKDENILRLLEKEIREKTTEDSKFRNTGINFLSDIIVFSYPYGKGQISGTLYNLLDKDAFMETMPGIAGEGKYCDASANVGTVISYIPSKHEQISSQLLKAEARKIIGTRSVRDHAVFRSGRKQNRYSELHLHTGKGTDNPQEVNLVFEQQERKFHLEGTVLSSAGNSTNKLPFVLKENGLHITNRIFTDEWADSLKTMLSFLTADLPDISGFSMNYYGTKLFNHTNGYMALPDMDLIVQCESPFSIKDFINTEGLKGDLDYSVDSGKISFGSESIYYKQLSNTCFYIGRNAAPSFSVPDDNELLKIKGSLHPLTLIKGSGWGVSLLKMLPMYQASNKLAETSEYIELTIVRNSNTRSTIKGDLVFKEGYFPMSEVMRFLLVSQLVSGK